MTLKNGIGEILATETILQDKHNNVSNIPTPRAFIKDKGGFDYVDEAYMRHLLNNHYPIWKWDIVKYEFIGDKVIVIHGRLTIIDNGVERHFDSVAAHRIASNQKGYVDLGNDLKGANSDAFHGWKSCVRMVSVSFRVSGTVDYRLTL